MELGFYTSEALHTKSQNSYFNSSCVQKIFRIGGKDQKNLQKQRLNKHCEHVLLDPEAT